MGIVALLWLLHNCEDHFHFDHSISSYNGYKLNSSFRRGFIAQFVEHCTGIAQVMGSNPVEVSELFLGFLCNWFTCLITAKITFTCILYPQCIYMIYIIYTLLLLLFLFLLLLLLLLVVGVVLMQKVLSLC